jgi:N-acetylmuramic acid 6-phosphate (MurNAc-6-P) etherase
MAKEYVRLLDEIQKDDAYSKIMQKEKSTLDTINLVVEHERSKSQRSMTLSTMSVSEILSEFAMEIVNVFEAVVNARRVDDIVNAVNQKRRSVYVGALFVFVAVVMLLLS